jgi:selenocysteine-specific elongation factor
VAAGTNSAEAIVKIGDLLISATAFQQARDQAGAAVNAFHSANPLVPGITKGELAEKLGLEATVFNAVLESLAREKKLETSAEIVRAAGRGVVMKDEEAESKKVIEQAFATAGLKVPALKDVLAGVKVDRARAQKIMTLLLRDRVLVKLADDLVFHRDALEQLRKLMAGAKARTPKINVATFKDLTGVSRKYAIPLLEYLDRERVTKRVGDERIIL